jgi:neutral amino acid transport system permease protein
MDFGTIISSALTALLSPTTAAYALAAIGLSVHFGYSGLLNFGQAGFMAVGAYTFAITTLTLGFSLPLAILATLVAATIFALILGIPTLRLRADYLAIVTIAAAEIVRFTVTTSTGGLDEYTGGATGLTAYNTEFARLNPLGGISVFGLSGTPLWAAVVGWALVAVATVLVWLLMRSPWGRVVKGIREDEDAVRSLGKNVYSYKMQALILGGAMGAMAGVVFVLPRAVQPGNYGTALTFFIWTALLLGGAATVFGPIVGAMIFWGVLTLTDGLLRGLIAADVITFISSNQVGPIRFMLVGVALMLLVIFRPQGIFGNKKELSFNV